MKSIIITILSIGIASSILQAQGPNQMTNVPASQFSGLVKGVINDSSSNKAIEYAIVGVYNLADSSLVSGSITDPKGVFALHTPTGKVLHGSIFSGLWKKRIQLDMTGQKPHSDIGTLVLHPDVKKIGEVTVVAQSNQVEYKIDKKVVNVNQDIASSGGSLVNLLENTPSMQVDIDGNVQLRGSGNFQLLIDGRPSVVQGKRRPPANPCQCCSKPGNHHKSIGKIRP